MPYITRPERKERPYNKETNYKRFDENNKVVYNTRRWKELRLLKLTKNPLCEICERKNILKCANEVHHIIYISSGNNVNEKIKIGFDIKNLMSLCSTCHKEIHLKTDYND